MMVLWSFIVCFFGFIVIFCHFYSILIRFVAEKIPRFLMIFDLLKLEALKQRKVFPKRA